MRRRATRRISTGSGPSRPVSQVADPPDPRRQDILPVVSYAAKRRLEGDGADYWDHATRLELALLARDRHEAEEAVADAVVSIREPWEPETTLRNLRLVRQARQRRGEAVDDWMLDVERALGGEPRSR